MKILIAEDDGATRCVLQAAIARWGFEPLATADGDQAWNELQKPDAPSIAILDSMMPGLDGEEICRRVRTRLSGRPCHIILLTSKSAKEDAIQGLGAGADDYVTKPFHHEELRARVNAGVRIVQLQLELADRVQKLEAALARVRQLEGLIPICSYCKRIRDDKNFWERVEVYIAKHSQAAFSHSICPACFKANFGTELKELET